MVKWLLTWGKRTRQLRQILGVNCSDYNIYNICTCRWRLSTFYVLSYINLKQIVLIQYIQCKGGSQAEVKRMSIVRHAWVSEDIRARGELWSWVRIICSQQVPYSLNIFLFAKYLERWLIRRNSRTLIFGLETFPSWASVASASMCWLLTGGFWEELQKPTSSSSFLEDEERKILKIKLYL